MPKKEIEAPQVEPVGKELLVTLEEFNREIESHRKAIEDIRIKARDMLKEAGFPWSFAKCRSLRCKYTKGQRVTCWGGCVRGEDGGIGEILSSCLHTKDSYEFDPTIKLPKQLPMLGWKRVTFKSSCFGEVRVDDVIRENSRYLVCKHCNVDKKDITASGHFGGGYTSAAFEKVTEYIEEKETKGE